MMISLIAAISQNQVIGIGNELPWHLPDDLAFFRHYTYHKPVVMGRRTFESLPGHLPGRAYIVLSRQSPPPNLSPHVHWVNRLEEAWFAARGHPEVVVIGGAQLYAMAMPWVHRLLLTQVEQTIDHPDAVCFPSWHPEQWTCYWQSERQEATQDAPASQIQAWTRKALT